MALWDGFDSSRFKTLEADTVWLVGGGESLVAHALPFPAPRENKLPTAFACVPASHLALRPAAGIIHGAISGPKVHVPIQPVTAFGRSMDAYLDGNAKVSAERSRKTESKLGFRVIRDLVRNILNEPPPEQGIVTRFALLAISPELLAGPVDRTENGVGENLVLFVPVIIRHSHCSVRAEFA